jgi:hypothetical protein
MAVTHGIEADAARTLFGSPGGVAPPGAPWSLDRPVLYTALCSGTAIAVCAPLAISRFRRSIEG